MLEFEREIWISRWPRRTCCIVGVDIPLFLNSLDIFARKVVSLVELVKVLIINTPLF